MKIHHLLSESGSDRATGYNMSSKLIRRDDTLFVSWLDAPSELGQPAKAMLGVCDRQSGEMRSRIQLGEGIDNHCGAALALDQNGRLHTIVGAHSGDFLYRWSDTPADAESWSASTPLGPSDTYPSLVVDAEGTLHLAHREAGRAVATVVQAQARGSTVGNAAAACNQSCSRLQSLHAVAHGRADGRASPNFPISLRRLGFSQRLSWTGGSEYAIG